MSPTAGILLAALAICVALSAFFSASESAYSSLNKVRIRNLCQEGSVKAQTALDISEDYDRLMTTILVGNNMVNIAGTSIAAVLFTMWIGSYGVTVSTIVMTVLILVFGEVSPRAIAKESPERLAVALAPAMKATIILLTPFNAFFMLWSRLLSRIFKPAESANDIEDELITMVDEAQSEGDMDAHEGELIRSAIEFNDQDALNILTPRVDVTALEDTATMEEAGEIFRESGYSRVPVYHEDMDHVVGILHEKDYHVQRHAGCSDITRIMRPPVWAPSTLKISKLLKLFQNSKTHMVIVVDEFGGTEGIVTLEDVLEELVGEIYDEHDDVSNDIIRMEDGSVLVEGGLQLAELMEHLGVADIYEADTAGGWSAEVLGSIPFVGASFETDELRGMVTKMEKRRVTQLRVWKKELTEESHEE
ncbi:MAG: HlyC/CorC family transporter [Clostridia bacterium]|nr:HlyC/CorC family transporter [Clostridia bacterium]